MYLNKKQQELLNVISFDIECIDIDLLNIDADNEYHFLLARDNLRNLLKQLDIKYKEIY